MGCGASLEAPDAGNKPSGEKKSSMQRQIETHGYPPPAVPTTKKHEVFDLAKMKHIDDHASKVPEEVLYGTYEEIGQYLTDICTTEVEKLRSLFTWTTSIDLASLQSTLEKLPEEGRPLDYLLKIHWKMGNHAVFFTKLCRAAGLPCVTVVGVNKSAAYVLGGPIDKKTMRALWNCVYVDGNWRYVDVYWASTCVVGKKTGDWNLMDVDGEMMDEDEDEEEGETKHQVNESYFMTDPDLLIFTHLPDDVQWQMLDKPVTFQTFEERVYIRERFFDTGQMLVGDSQEKCLVKPKNGELDFTFGFVQDCDPKQIVFTYTLFRMKSPPPEIPFERFVFLYKKDHKIFYKCRFPATGKYKMDMYGKDENRDDEFDLCASYVIECDVAKPNCQPFPDSPQEGWGMTKQGDELGLIPKSHADPIINTKNGLVEIRFQTTDPVNLRQVLQCNNLEQEDLINNAHISQENGEAVVSLRLPKKGEYALNLFGTKDGKTGDLSKVSTYLINVERDNPSLKPFPRIQEGNIGKASYADKLKVKAKESQCRIKTDDGKVTFDFEHDRAIEMLCEINHVDMSKESLCKTGKVTNAETSSSIDIELPLIGEYSVNVYARNKWDAERLYHVHSYLIDSKQSTKGDFQVTREKPKVILGSTGRNEVSVNVGETESEVVANFQKKDAILPVEKNQIKAQKTDAGHKITAQLNEAATYKMEVFDKKENGMLMHKSTFGLKRLEMTDELKYQIESENIAAQEAKESQKAFSEEKKKLNEQQRLQERAWKAERDALKAAMSTQNPAAIQAAIAKFEEANVPDDKGLLSKAKDLLNFLQISTELNEAMAERNLSRLENVCDAAVKQGFDKKLGLQYLAGVKLRDQLRRLEKLRHAILDLDQKTIAEIKSYSKPPEGVHKVMIATFLLLGNTESELKEWPKVVVLIGKTGKESLKRRITQDFKVEKLKLAVAKKAMSHLKGFELDYIRDLSAGAATFYVWVTGMVEECEARNS